MRKELKAIIPLPVLSLRIRRWEAPAVRRIRYFGLSRYCPVCRSHVRKFVDFGRITILKNEECPLCGSHRRHRTMSLYFDSNRSKFFGSAGMRLLEVAPLKCFSQRLACDPNIDYLSADLNSPLAMVKMDLTNIQYPDNYFDAIYCSHVLEHIPDDRKAMQELNRVLNVGGWAILQVPIDLNREHTYEDPSIQSPDDRERAFGQFDHVRFYGRDYQDRLEAAGFKVTVDSFVKSLSTHTIERCGLDPEEGIYFCEKRAQGV
jgi:SAM-dependent methyltransferase